MPGSAEFQRMARRERPGTASLSKANRFALNSVAMSLTPVMFPPGLPRLATSPGTLGIGHVEHDDRDRLRRLFRSQGSRCADRDDEVEIEMRQFRRQADKVLALPWEYRHSMERFLPLRVTSFGQRLQKALEQE